MTAAVFEADGATLLHGDCIDVMASMPDCLVDAIVTDPPYGLRFMGREWDGFSDAAAFEEWCRRWAVEALRVLRPGGHLVAFGGTRTYHRLTAGLEDAGFEIRDCLAWLYGSGFPKSHNVSKAIDKAAGVERPVVGTTPDRWTGMGAVYEWGRQGPRADRANEAPKGVVNITTPATEDAARWEGWGTALKPAFEPAVLARKPLGGTVAATVLEHGTGALNIDGCRLPVDPDDPINTAVWTSRASSIRPDTAGFVMSNRPGDRQLTAPRNGGRFPANVLLDSTAAGMLDEAVGERRSGSRRAGVRKGLGYHGAGGDGGPAIEASSGGPSRFFYCSKASQKERRGSKHPTVKPLDLMRWLVRLVTPPGGVVLDPFAGSGTTGEAARAEGFDVILIERDGDYLEDIRTRLANGDIAEG